MSDTLFIHAVNVHQGGGERLLLDLLGTLGSHRQVVLNVDQRMPLPATLPVGLEVRRIRRSVLARLLTELWLYRQTTDSDSVLCFGNLPPLLPTKAFTSVFVQNRYLIDGVSLRGLNPWSRFRIQLERLWLRLSLSHADQYLVQTPSMQGLMSEIVKNARPVLVAPFVSSGGAATSTTESRAAEQLPKFVYIASGDEHKNHRRLLEAWCLLAAEGIRPSLTLTVDTSKFSKLCGWMFAQIEAHKLNVNNLGTVDAAVVTDLYARSDALIYPSLLESFGLPLIEASTAGLVVLAAELDYVRDVVQPEHSFDPASALSIARAVKRYCGCSNPALQLLSPAQFLDMSIRRAG